MAYSVREVAVMAGTGSEQVWVQVIDVEVAANREITFGRTLAEGLGDRVDDVRTAIGAGSESVGKSLKSLASPGEGWGTEGGFRFLRDHPYRGNGRDRVQGLGRGDLRGFG